MKRIALLCALAVAVVALPACSTVRPVAYNPPAHRPQNPANVRVKISLQNQAVYVMEGERPLLVAATCVGVPTKPTPRGDFRIYSKQANKRSGSYGFFVNGNTITPGESSKGGRGRYVGYPMAYWCEFAPAYGIHQGYVWPFPRTHGCLRLHRTVAPKFFALVSVGTRVNIASSQPEDATIGKNLARPTDYKDPDPPASILTSSAAFAPPDGPLFVD